MRGFHPLDDVPFRAVFIYKVSNATVGARIKKLKDIGVVRVVASTDIRAAGFEAIAIGSMEVASGKPDTCDAVARELAQVPQIISIGTRLHKRQIMFYVIGRDAADIEQILSTTASSIKAIKDVQVRIVNCTLERVIAFCLVS